MVTGPGFSSPNQPDQERTTAYRDSSGPDSRSDAHCATIVGDWEKPSGESRASVVNRLILDILAKRNLIVASSIFVCGAGGLVVHLILLSGYRDEYLALLRHVGWLLIRPDVVFFKIGLSLAIITGFGLYVLARRESFLYWMKRPGRFDLIFYAILAVHVVLNVTAKEGMTKEDGFFEWLTFWYALVAALIWAWLSIRYRLVPFLLPFAFFLFFAMEEISWGQRLFEWETPEFIGSVNYQNETNIHNIFSPRVKFFTSAFFIAVSLILIEINLLFRALGDSQERWTRCILHAVSVPLLPAVFCALGIVALRYLEYTEVVFSIISLLLVLRVASFQANLGISAQ